MIKLYVLFYITILTIVTGQIFRSDYKYFDRVGGWLKYHYKPAVWNDARLRCHVEGGVLASPVTEEIGSILIKTMKEEGPSAIFTGIHSTYSKGDYVSIEGIPLDSIPNIRSKLDIDNKNNEEECLIMFTSGSMADVKCQNVYPYICYKQYDPHLPEPSECGTTDRGYTYSQVTGHCYKFHRYGQPWDRAYMTCAAEGGYLAIINSEQESQVIQEVFGKYPEDHIVGRSKWWAHIGYKSDKENNFWMTIHGQSLTEAGFASWGAGEPNNASDPLLEYGQHCGNMQRVGKLDDNQCLGSSPFICEKHPETLQ